MSDKTQRPIAIWALAHELGVKSGDLRRTMDGWGLGWDVGNHMRRLSPAQADEARRRLGGQPAETEPLKVARAEEWPKVKEKVKVKEKAKAKAKTKAKKAVKETVKKLKKKKLKKAQKKKKSGKKNKKK